MGQVVFALNNRPHGSLPTDTKSNLKGEGRGHCNAVTLHRGKQVEVKGEIRSRWVQTSKL